MPVGRRHGRPTHRASPVAGAVAGLWAGAVSSAPGLAYALTTGRGIWEPIRLVSTVVGGRAGRSFASLPVAAGGLVHVTLSALYGAAYARATPAPTERAVLRGVAYGFLLHVVNIRLVTRAPRFRRLRTETSEPVELLAHVLYGAALAQALQRRSRQVERPGLR